MDHPPDPAASLLKLETDAAMVPVECKAAESEDFTCTEYTVPIKEEDVETVDIASVSPGSSKDVREYNISMTRREIEMEIRQKELRIMEQQLELEQMLRQQMELRQMELEEQDLQRQKNRMRRKSPWPRPEPVNYTVIRGKRKGSELFAADSGHLYLQRDRTYLQCCLSKWKGLMCQGTAKIDSDAYLVERKPHSHSVDHPDLQKRRFLNELRNAVAKDDTGRTLQEIYDDVLKSYPVGRLLKFRSVRLTLQRDLRAKRQKSKPLTRSQAAEQSRLLQEGHELEPSASASTSSTESAQRYSLRANQAEKRRYLEWSDESESSDSGEASKLDPQTSTPKASHEEGSPGLTSTNTAQHSMPRQGQSAKRLRASLGHPLPKPSEAVESDLLVPATVASHQEGSSDITSADTGQQPPLYSSHQLGMTRFLTSMDVPTRPGSAPEPTPTSATTANHQSSVDLPTRLGDAPERELMMPSTTASHQSSVGLPTRPGHVQPVPATTASHQHQLGHIPSIMEKRLRASLGHPLPKPSEAAESDLLVPATVASHQEGSSDITSADTGQQPPLYSSHQLGATRFLTSMDVPTRPGQVPEPTPMSATTASHQSSVGLPTRPGHVQPVPAIAASHQHQLGHIPSIMEITRRLPSTCLQSRLDQVLGPKPVSATTTSRGTSMCPTRPGQALQHELMMPSTTASPRSALDLPIGPRQAQPVLTSTASLQPPMGLPARPVRVQPMPATAASQQHPLWRTPGMFEETSSCHGQGYRDIAPKKSLRRPVTGKKAVPRRPLMMPGEIAGSRQPLIIPGHRIAPKPPQSCVAAAPNMAPKPPQQCVPTGPKIAPKPPPGSATAGPNMASKPPQQCVTDDRKMTPKDFATLIDCADPDSRRNLAFIVKGSTNDEAAIAFFARRVTTEAEKYPVDSNMQIDASLKVAPSVGGFLQLLVVSFELHRQMRPGFFVLVSHRSRPLFNGVLRVIKARMVKKAPLRPAHVAAEPEPTLVAAVVDSWPKAKVSGCLSHYCRAVLGQLREQGLTAQFRTSEAVRKWVTMLLAVPLLPADHLEEALELLINQLPANVDNDVKEGLRRLCVYVVEECLWKLGRRLSVFDTPGTDSQDADSFLRDLRIKYQVNSSAGINFWAFVSALNTVIANVDRYVEQRAAGPWLPRASVLKPLLVRLAADLTSGRATVLTYLQAAGAQLLATGLVVTDVERPPQPVTVPPPPGPDSGPAAGATSSRETTDVWEEVSRQQAGGDTSPDADRQKVDLRDEASEVLTDDLYDSDADLEAVGVKEEASESLSDDFSDSDTGPETIEVKVEAPWLLEDDASDSDAAPGTVEVKMEAQWMVEDGISSPDIHHQLRLVKEECRLEDEVVPQTAPRGPDVHEATSEEVNDGAAAAAEAVLLVNGIKQERPDPLSLNPEVGVATESGAEDNLRRLRPILS